jgi:hypothetical protein
MSELSRFSSRGSEGYGACFDEGAARKSPQSFFSFRRYPVSLFATQKEKWGNIPQRGFHAVTPR